MTQGYLGLGTAPPLVQLCPSPCLPHGCSPPFLLLSSCVLHQLEPAVDTGLRRIHYPLLRQKHSDSPRFSAYVLGVFTQVLRT